MKQRRVGMCEREMSARSLNALKPRKTMKQKKVGSFKGEVSRNLYLIYRVRVRERERLVQTRVL